MLAAGCQQTPPAVVALPRETPPAPINKPLPPVEGDVGSIPAPGFGDPAVVEQKLPEEAWFVSAYDAVGRPRIALYVNRNPRDNGQPQAGQYDDSVIKELDYSELEETLIDWISCDGKVTVVAPAISGHALSEDQQRQLSSGNASAGDLARQLQADILIQVQVHPVRRPEGVRAAVVAQAVNVKGNESIARAEVEIPSPMDNETINAYTRFLARKLMHEMVGTWTHFKPTAGAEGAGTTPGTPAPGDGTPGGGTPPSTPPEQPMPPGGGSNPPSPITPPEQPVPPGNNPPAPPATPPSTQQEPTPQPVQPNVPSTQGT